MLDAAGYSDSNPLEFDIIFPGTHYGRDWPARAETWQSMMQESGARVHLTSIDYQAEWIPNYLRAKGNYPGRDGRAGMIMRPFGGSADAGQFFSRALTSSGSSQIVGDYWPELDEMVAAQQQIFDFDERVEHIHNIQRFLMENMVVIPMQPTIDPPGIKWDGVHGPERWLVFPGGQAAAQSADVHHKWWLDETLRA